MDKMPSPSINEVIVENIIFHPNIYDKSHENYNSQTARNNSLSEIAAKVDEATNESVLNKIRFIQAFIWQSLKCLYFT